MITINLNLEIKNSDFKMQNEDEQKLSFLVSRLFEEYIEDKQDYELSKHIKSSKKLDSVISNIQI